MCVYVQRTQALAGIRPRWLYAAKRWIAAYIVRKIAAVITHLWQLSGIPLP